MWSTIMKASAIVLFLTAQALCGNCWPQMDVIGQRAGSTAEHAKNGLYSSISSVVKRVFREVAAGNTEIKAEIPACTSTSSVR